MPIYVMKCACGHREDIFRTIKDIDRDLPAHCGKTMARAVVAPMVAVDIAPYRSMATGEMITSRSQHRSHLKQHGLIEVGNEKIKPAPTRIPEPAGLKQTIIDVVNAKL